MAAQVGSSLIGNLPLLLRIVVRRSVYQGVQRSKCWDKTDLEG